MFEEFGKSTLISKLLVKFAILIVFVNGAPAPQFSILSASSGGNAGGNVGGTVFGEATGLASSAADFKGNLLAPSGERRETAKLESEALPSRVLSVYDNRHQQRAKAINQPPIIDTTREEDKYGNTAGFFGDSFSGVGKAAVDTYESFSNLVNFAIDRPPEIIRSIAKVVVDRLNDIGKRVIGLE